MIDIGRVFSTSFAMLRQRFWQLVGVWAVFFAIQIAASIVLGIGTLVMGAAGIASLDTGLADPAAITGMSIGLIIFMALFYGAYLVVVLAQQAAMVTMASPLEEPAFGAAVSRGFKSALPFFGIALLLMLGYFTLVTAMAGIVGMASLGSAAAGSLLGGSLAVLLAPVMVYLGCRFVVLIPVVAVDQVFNPLAAVRRSWAVTRGKVMRILLALLVFGAISLMILGVPFFLIFGAVFTGQDWPAAGAGLILLGILLFIPLMIVYIMFAAAFTAALHSEVTGGGAEKLEEVFA
ncbi:MAG: hypothetical protein EAY70_10330 [Sphingomonadales bacterium]|nr:MAG: hypothetical protein EAY70_10330 [Sphingomonadales bacterium]